MATTTKTPGVIRADEAYRLDEIMVRMGWGRHALTAARQRGLQVKQCGKRRFCLGADVLRFIEASSTSETS